MPDDFENRWQEALAKYKSAIVDCDRIAAEITEKIRGGAAPDSMSLSREDRARTRLLDARTTVVILLRERKARRAD